MLPITLLIVAGVFAFLLLGRLGGSQRTNLRGRWPALLFAVAAGLALTRGAMGPALALLCAAVLAWLLGPGLAQRSTSAGAGPDPAEAEARRLLGVGAAATDTEIRSAYRARMAAAHPDRGGRHGEAAQLTAARDRLLKKN